MQSAVRTGKKENGAVYLAVAAHQEAAYGYPAEARRFASEALRLFPESKRVESEAALALAMAGIDLFRSSLEKDRIMSSKSLYLVNPITNKNALEIGVRLPRDRRSMAFVAGTALTGSKMRL